MQIMNKKRCIYCKQIQDGTMKSFMDTHSCNAPDGDGHLWEYNSAYKTPYTEKFPFRYTVQVRSYFAHTVREQDWIKLQEKLELDNLFDFTPTMVMKLSAGSFTVIKRYGG